jgi:Glycosyltransferase
VHLSNLRIDKGLGRAIESLRAAVHAGLDVELLLGGPLAGQDEATLLQEGTREFGSRIRHVGALATEDVPAFLAGADLFLFPSLYRNEAEPLVVLEAMAAGVPVLMYAVGCANCMTPSALPPVEVSLEFGPRVVGLLGDLTDAAVAARFRADSRRQLSNMRKQARDRLSRLAEWLAWETDTYD